MPDRFHRPHRKLKSHISLCSRHFRSGPTSVLDTHARSPSDIPDGIMRMNDRDQAVTATRGFRNDKAVRSCSWPVGRRSRLSRRRCCEDCLCVARASAFLPIPQGPCPRSTGTADPRIIVVEPIKPQHAPNGSSFLAGSRYCCDPFLSSAAPEGLDAAFILAKAPPRVCRRAGHIVEKSRFGRVVRAMRATG